MTTLADISDLLAKVFGSSIGPVPFFVLPALVLGIVVAVWFLSANVKKEVVMDPSKSSSLKTAKEWLEENASEDAGGVGFEPTKEKGLRIEDNNGKVDLEDKLINALITAVGNAQVSSGRLSLVIDPSADKKISLAKSQIDFDLSPPANGEGNVVSPTVPVPPQEEAEEGAV